MTKQEIKKRQEEYRRQFDKKVTVGDKVMSNWEKKKEKWIKKNN